MFRKISQNSQENTCARVTCVRPEAYNFIKKETPVQIFSWGFCEISKNTFFTEHLRMTASEWWNNQRSLIWSTDNLSSFKWLIWSWDRTFWKSNLKTFFFGPCNFELTKKDLEKKLLCCTANYFLKAVTA